LRERPPSIAAQPSSRLRSIIATKTRPVILDLTRALRGQDRRSRPAGSSRLKRSSSARPFHCCGRRGGLPGPYTSCGRHQRKVWHQDHACRYRRQAPPSCPRRVHLDLSKERSGAPVGCAPFSASSSGRSGGVVNRLRPYWMYRWHKSATVRIALRRLGSLLSFEYIAHSQCARLLSKQMPERQAPFRVASK
jgi:hypothetical protein